jgi:glycosyltransferase involved in cell wall biosynthesis
MAPRPIKVMEIIARMNVGGPAVIVAELIRGLSGEDFEVKLVTGYCDSGEADYLETVATDISATRIGGLGRSVSPLKDFLSFFTLLREIKAFAPDVIHTHTAKAGVLGRLAALLAAPRATRIHTFHGHLLHGYFNPVVTRLVIWTERILALLTQQLVAVGNQVKNDLIKAGIGSEKKFSVLFPGIPDPLQIDKSAARRQVGFDADGIYITFVGRLTNIKRPDRLLDVAKILKISSIKAEIVIVGEGDLFARVQRRATEEDLPVKFLGWRSNVAEIFAASDMAILTSDNEGIPLTLIQAAQAGLPIVATNVGSISDIVVNGKTGLLTEPTADALAGAVIGLLANSEQMLTFGTQGRAHAKEYFSLSRMIADHTHLYKLGK